MSKIYQLHFTYSGSFINSTRRILSESTGYLKLATSRWFRYKSETTANQV